MPNPFLLEKKEAKEKPVKEINPFLLQKEQDRALPNPFLETNFSEEQKEKISFGRKALSFLNKAVNEYGQDRELKQLTFTKLLATPAGQYYAEMGSRLHADYFLQKAGVPETFNIDPSIKYAPHILKLAEVSGADITKMKDRLSLAIFLDYLGVKGYGMLKNAVLHVNKPSEAIKQVVGGLQEKAGSLAKLDDEALQITNKELARVMTQPTKSAPTVVNEWQTVEKATTASEAGFFSEGQISASVRPSTVFPQDVVIAGVKYRTVGGQKPFETIKLASITDKVEQVGKTAKIANNPSEIIKGGETLKDILPEVGQKQNVGDFFKNGLFAIIRSPQYYASELYETIGNMERAEAKIVNTYASKFAPFLKLEGSELAKTVGMVADGHPEAANILASGKLGNEGLKLLEVWRSVSEDIANKLGLPQSKRVLNYLTHMWDDLKNKDFATDEQLQLWIKENGNFLKDRKGMPGYNLDILKVAKKYISWAAKHIATKEFKTSLFEKVDNLKAINKTRGDMAEYYLHNYFGTLNKALGINKTIANISGAIKTNFAQGTLGFNIATALTNLTQPLIFGASRIGYKAVFNGYKLAARAFSENQYWKKILEDGAILSNQGFREMNEGFSVWRKLLGNKIVDASMAFMQASENLNKATVYLGSWDSAYTKIKTFLSNPQKYGRLGKWLEARGVRLGEDAVEESHKFARRETMNTQLDYTRAGQNFIAANPTTSAFYMYMTFPIKAGEMVLHNTKNAAVILGKAIVNPKLIPTALQSPEVFTSLRLAANIALLNGAAIYSGVSLSRLAGVENFIPNVAPLMNVALTAWNAAKNFSEKDPVAGEKLIKNLMILSGLPATNPIWKVKALLETATYNKDRKDGNWTIVNPKNGNERYTVPIWEFVRDMFTPIKSATSEQYFKDLKESLKDRRIMRNLGSAIKQAVAKDDAEKAEKLRQDRVEWRRKIGERERIRKQRERGMRRGD